MSILGIDFGTASCVLATVQRGTVTTIRNDLSERLTPSLVGYTSKERHIGEAAQTHVKSNYKNTSRYFKQLMGLTHADQSEIEYEQKYTLAPLEFVSEKEGGFVGHKIHYKDKQYIIVPPTALAALLTHLKTIAEKFTKNPVENIVIGVPGWYSNAARKAILDACDIAKLRCLRVMNEHAALALDYGIYRSKTFDAEKPTRVAFLGIGHGSTFVSVVDFVREQLRVVAFGSDKHLGGRDIDRVLMQHFSNDFKRQYNLDPMENSKARLKLEETATKIKKVLSANSEAPFHIECLIDDYEMTGILTRQEFENLCTPFKERLLQLLTSTFESYNINIDSIKDIEILGGCCRSPWAQQTIMEFFDNRVTLSKTLSMDETVARGCALQAAMLDPRYKVREYGTVDCLFNTVTVAYYSTAGQSKGEGESILKTGLLFDRTSQLGSRKWLTFTRSHDFEIQLLQGNCLSNIVPTKDKPYSTSSPLITRIVLPRTDFDQFEQSTKRVKVAVKLTMHGTLVCESAQLLIDEEVDVVSEKTKLSNDQTKTSNNQASDIPQQTPMVDDKGMQNKVTGTHPDESTIPISSDQEQKIGVNAEQKKFSADADDHNVKTKKIVTHRFNCDLNQSTYLGYMPQNMKDQLADEEQQMAQSDLSQFLLRECMNDLEAYIYRMQDLFSSTLKKFATDNEVQQITQALQQAHVWLYDVADENVTPKEDYQAQFDMLKTLCEPIKKREYEYELRQQAFEELSEAIEILRQSTGPEKVATDWSHIQPNKINELISKIDETERWLQQVAETSHKTPLYEPVTVNSELIQQEKNMLINFSKTILIAKPTSKIEQKTQNGKVIDDPADMKTQTPISTPNDNTTDPTCHMPPTEDDNSEEIE